MPLKIFLADLVYDTVKTNFVVPLNIAYVAAYAKDNFGNNVDISLYKYPSDLEKALKASPPDVLGLSNYSWNERLDLLFLRLAKRINPNIVTVMGGPNVSVRAAAIMQYLKARPELDYYILNEGEKPFSHLVGRLLENPDKTNHRFPIEGTATISRGDFHFQLMDFKNATKKLDLPSPYLNGWLDKFLADSDMIPLLETNRGCPYGCVYCQWGTAALSKIKDRPEKDIYQEMDYIAKKSAKQKTWIFCDANFGIKKRDIDFARHIRKIKDKYGYPVEVVLWHAKNTSERNIEIVETIGDGASGYVAIQSSDPNVLNNAGRGAIKFERLKQFTQYYRNRNLNVSTDLLIGLPGESAQSHLQTICDAFSLGFTRIDPINIRMLDGTSYASPESRAKYQIKVKYRPLFGAYGKYDGQNIFEIEKSVRATKDITEEELNGFKIVHWLIYFAWNSGIFRNHLRLAQHNGINQGIILYNLSHSEHSALKPFFDEFRQASRKEWFDTPEEMQKHFEKEEIFQQLIEGFAKLNFLYVAKAFHNTKIFNAIQEEMERLIQINLSDNEKYNLEAIFSELRSVGEHLICRDPLSQAKCINLEISGELASIILEKPGLVDVNKVQIKITRTENRRRLCQHYFPDKNNITLNNWLRFLEGPGLSLLTNAMEMVSDRSFSPYSSAPALPEVV